MASISIDPRKLSTNLGPVATGWAYTGFSGIAIVLLASLWFGLAKPLTVVVDGVEHRVTTHRHTVGAILKDLDVATTEVDRVSPGHDAPLHRGQTIVVERAQSYRLFIDGRMVDMQSWGETVGDVFADAGFMIDPKDTIHLNGTLVEKYTPLPRVGPSELVNLADSALSMQPAGSPANPEPHQIQVARSIPLTIHDGGMAFEVKTTALTVGEALRQADLTIYLGDRVDPELSAPVSTGLKVHIQRSRPVHVQVAGQELRTRTRAETVAEALAEMRIGLSGQDQIVPALDTPIVDSLDIQITRVNEEVVIEEEIAPFDTVFRPDPNLAIDTQEVSSPGAEGITRSRYRVRYENGAEVSRVHEDTWTAQDPADRVISYGQLIQPRTTTTADGREITYWRRIQMHASSYSAGTAGVSPSSPHYGYTRTGDRMRHGIVAVDPSIIPLRTQVYVPGYGVGDALDTGSAIISRRIDLGYDDSNLELWSQSVDVYLLWPPPPSHQITWVIPNWPRPPQ